MRTRAMRGLVTTAAVAVACLGLAGPASAHDPIFLSDDQTNPDTGPYMPDGSISWALYGSVLEDEDTRGFEFDLREGDELYISLLIPNLEPETGLGDEELPVLELESPSGAVRTIVADMRVEFDEPFSRTSYVTLAELREPAEAGRYRGMVIGTAPSRFSVAIGEEEIFFTETERSGDRPTSFPEMAAPLSAWYATPPGGEPVEIGEDDATIDMDLLDEAMESGEATDSRDGADEAVTATDDAEAAATAEGGADDSDGLGLVAPILVVALLAGGVGFWWLRSRGRGVDAASDS